jgi:hypothetical protein
MIIGGILLIVFTLFLAGKDATSYSLKDKNSSPTPLTFVRLDRWHRDGVALAALFTIAVAWATGEWWKIPLLALFIRLAIYDIAFNKWASLPLSYLGTTAIWDKIFVSIFGKEGAIRKGIFFSAISLIWLIYEGIF